MRDIVVKVVLHEYQPGEYCDAAQCPWYNDGKFDDECGECAAFAYYKWLKSNGYRLVRSSVERTPGREK